MEAAASPLFRAPLASISGFRFTTGGWVARTRSCMWIRTHLWWAAKRQVVSFVQRRAGAGQTAPPPSLLLFRTLRRVHAMRSELLELVTKSGRVKKLVHLRSPREMARWLGDVTRTPAEVAE